MRELPKELTAELLGKVLHYRFKIKILDIKGNNLIYQELDNLGYVLNQAEINIDTLTRLAKEWCLKQKYWVSSELTSTSKGLVGCGVFGSEEHLCSEVEDTEFEAVLKATHWVAKEKGLI